jgi:hypothetical protein
MQTHSDDTVEHFTHQLRTPQEIRLGRGTTRLAGPFSAAPKHKMVAQDGSRGGARPMRDFHTTTLSEPGSPVHSISAYDSASVRHVGTNYQGHKELLEISVLIAGLADVEGAFEGGVEILNPAESSGMKNGEFTGDGILQIHGLDEMVLRANENRIPSIGSLMASASLALASRRLEVALVGWSTSMSEIEWLALNQIEPVIGSPAQKPLGNRPYQDYVELGRITNWSMLAWECARDKRVWLNAYAIVTILQMQVDNALRRDNPSKLDVQLPSELLFNQALSASDRVRLSAYSAYGGLVNHVALLVLSIRQMYTRVNRIWSFQMTWPTSGLNEEREKIYKKACLGIVIADETPGAPGGFLVSLTEVYVLDIAQGKVFYGKDPGGTKPVQHVTKT